MHKIKKIQLYKKYVEKLSLQKDCAKQYVKQQYESTYAESYIRLEHILMKQRKK